MSREEHPTLKMLYNKGFALTQAMSKRMSSSAPLPQTHNPGSLSLPGPSPVTDSGLRSVDDPAARLLTDFFDEMDQLDTPEAIDSSYILLPESSPARPRPRTRLGVKTSELSLNSPNIPDHPPTSPSSESSESEDDGSFNYSRPHVNSTVDLLALVTKFGEIQARNGQFINGDTEFISNSLPNPELRSWLKSSPADAYEQEYQDTIKNLKEIFESSTFLTGAQMRAMAPKVIYTPAKGKTKSESDKLEKEAVEILEALFGELGERDERSRSDRWKTADELISGIFSKNKGGKDAAYNSKNKGESKKVELEHIESVDYSKEHKADKKTHQVADTNISRDINLNFSHEETDNDDAENLARVENDINFSIRHTKLGKLVGGSKEPQTPPQKSGEFEATSFSQFGSKGDERLSQSLAHLQKAIPVLEHEKIAENKENVDEEHHDGNSDSEKSFKTPRSTRAQSEGDSQVGNKEYSANRDEDNNADAENHSSSSSIKNGSTTGLSSDISTDESTQGYDPQLEMAALATGIVAASLWMIERKMKPF